MRWRSVTPQGHYEQDPATAIDDKLEYWNGYWQRGLALTPESLEQLREAARGETLPPTNA